MRAQSVGRRIRGCKVGKPMNVGVYNNNLLSAITIKQTLIAFYISTS